jgi:hypothetical protein
MTFWSVGITRLMEPHHQFTDPFLFTVDQTIVDRGLGGGQVMLSIALQ